MILLFQIVLDDFNLEEGTEDFFMKLVKLSKMKWLKDYMMREGGIWSMLFPCEKGERGWGVGEDRLEAVISTSWGKQDRIKLNREENILSVQPLEVADV